MWASGNFESCEYDLSGFTAVNAGSAFKIEIIQSDTFGVTVRADHNMFSKLVVRASGGTLHLHKKSFPWTFSCTTPEATIRMPALDSIELNGAASARVREFRGIDRLDAELTGASKLKATVDAASIDVLALGASRLTLAGSARRVTLDASGASQVDLGKLRAAAGTVELSGASGATVNFSEAIDRVEISGASRLRYLGDPAMGYVESSGASRMTRIP